MPATQQTRKSEIVLLAYVFIEFKIIDSWLRKLEIVKNRAKIQIFSNPPPPNMEVQFAFIQTAPE